MLRVLPKYELLQLSAGKPIVLAGPPDALTGEVEMTNPGDDHVVVRSVQLRDLPEPSAGEIQVPVVAILRAGHGARTRVTARLNPLTPPGRYKATLALGEFSYPAELFVTENIDFEMDPDPLVVDNRPGTRIEKQVLFRNNGNSNLVIGTPGPLLLDEQDMSCRILRSGLAAGSEDGADDVNKWLTAFLRQAHRNVREAGMLFLRNKDGETIVPPGGSQTVDFVLRLPDTLKANTRYFSLAYFYTETLSISIVPAGGYDAETLEPAEEVTEPRPERSSKRSRSAS
jgi:hypothetical protein